jgi:hypothetical protein
MISYRAYITTIIHFYSDLPFTYTFIHYTHLGFATFHIFTLRHFTCIALLFSFYIFLAFYYIIPFHFHFLLPLDGIPFIAQFWDKQQDLNLTFIFTWRLMVVWAVSGLSGSPVPSRLLPVSHPPHATYLQLVFSPLLLYLSNDDLHFTLLDLISFLRIQGKNYLHYSFHCLLSTSISSARP